MQTATKNLEDDHVQILRLTDIMEAMLSLSHPDPGDLEKVVFLIRNYADGFHHEKEEQLLFPKLGEKGFRTDQGPVAVMLHEHVQGREFVKGMAEAIALYRIGQMDALGKVYRNMEGYVNLLRSHIGKENQVLFRMADQMLTPAEQEELLAAFAKVAAQASPERTTTAFLALLDELEHKVNMASHESSN